MVTASPSPFDDYLTIRAEYAEANQPFYLQLSNVLGQVVYHANYTTDLGGMLEQRISLEGLAKGAYILEIHVGMQRKAIKVQKF